MRALSLGKIAAEEHPGIGGASLPWPDRPRHRRPSARRLAERALLPHLSSPSPAQRTGASTSWSSAVREAPTPELTAASTVSPAVVHEATAYLQAGGRDNLVHLLRFLSDHLLMTGFGYDPPAERPQHGVYHPDPPQDATLDDFS